MKTFLCKKLINNNNNKNNPISTYREKDFLDA